VGFFGYSGQLDQRAPLVIPLIDRVYFIIVASKSVNKACCYQHFGKISYLAKLNINPDSYKAKYQFSVQKESVYQILDGFPAITSQNLPHAIFDVSYRLILNDISDYLIEEDTMNGLF